MLGDPAMYYIGWELFRQDPHWHWPLTYTDRLGYPTGEAAALTGFHPVLAVLFKLVSPLLPEPFQYLGIDVVLLCALQFFFATRLFGLILHWNRIGVFLCSLFFLVAPPLAWHFTRHYALANHWLLIAALMVYLKAQEETPRAIRRFVVCALLLTAFSLATDPYLAFPVVLVMTAAAGSLLWQHKLTLAKAAGFMAAMGASCALVIYSLGFFIAGGVGYGQGGYRLYSLNLLAPFDPYVYGSILPRLPHGRTDVGAVYLGAGVLFLALILLMGVTMRREKRPLLSTPRLAPLFLCCVILTLLAISTRVTMGTIVLFDFDPHQHLTRFFAPLRSSICLFWVPYYAILAAVLAAPFLFLRRSHANLLLAVVLLVQIVDVLPLLRWAHSRVIPSEITGLWKPGDLQPLKSPVWSRLGSMHENLMVLPAWQCRDLSSPGGLEGCQTFGLLAAAQRMRINSYRSPRYTEINFDSQCRQAIVDLAEKPLSPDTAYVVSPALAAVIAAGPTGPGKCHTVDGFILCSSKIDFGPDDELKNP
jgi:hypothetical protein